MNKETLKIYNRVWDELLDLMNDEKEEVIISSYELSKLDYLSIEEEYKEPYIRTEDATIVPIYVESKGILNNCCDSIKHWFGDFIDMEKDLLTNNLIIKKRKQR